MAGAVVVVGEREAAVLAWVQRPRTQIQTASAAQHDGDAWRHQRGAGPERIVACPKRASLVFAHCRRSEVP